ncbi:MAG: cytochrome-c peroxidase [Sphingobacteriia bacterium]|nr:cytochrome-c peroxidase [Sphingobacteriia bacterium]
MINKFSVFSDGLKFSILAIGLIACSRDAELQSPNLSPYSIDIPAGFPSPDIPADNAMTQNRVSLGKRLFFEKALSIDSSISCASCHFQIHGFSDPKRFSLGVGDSIGVRNAMALSNVAYQEDFFWDGGVPSLELQVLAPIENPLEMNFSVPQVVERLKKDPSYIYDFKKAYNREPDAYALVRAIAAFERTFISGNSPFDQYTYQGKTSALSASALRGKDIFFGEKAECFHCHTGFNFTDNRFQNNGLYSEYQDIGRARVTIKSSDIGRFKTPSLRNIEVTAPYMHDGSIASLEAVVQHYMSGGKGHPNQSPLIKPFTLTLQEQQDLIAFLKSLTDESFLNRQSLQP